MRTFDNNCNFRAVTPGDDNDAFAMDLKWKIEEAKLLWAQNRSELAMRLAAGLLKSHKAADARIILVPQLMLLLGKWQSEKR